MVKYLLSQNEIRRSGRNQSHNSFATSCTTNNERSMNMHHNTAKNQKLLIVIRIVSICYQSGCKTETTERRQSNICEISHT